MTTVRFTCPSCEQKLAAIEVGAATRVVRRTCPRCGERWQLVVAEAGSLRDGQVQLHRAEFTFIDRRGKAARSYEG